MLLIECPWCGQRDEVEFSYGGQAYVSYPEDPYALDERQWGSFLFVRNNSAGSYVERWVHTAGCRRWFNLTRNTVTNDVGKATPVHLGNSTGSAGQLPQQRGRNEVHR